MSDLKARSHIPTRLSVALTARWSETDQLHPNGTGMSHTTTRLSVRRTPALSQLLSCCSPYKDESLSYVNRAVSREINPRILFNILSFVIHFLSILVASHCMVCVFTFDIQWQVRDQNIKKLLCKFPSCIFSSYAPDTITYLICQFLCDHVVKS